MNEGWIMKDGEIFSEITKHIHEPGEATKKQLDQIEKMLKEIIKILVVQGKIGANTEERLTKLEKPGQ